VVRRGAAAPADGGHAELGDEAVQVIGQALGREVVVHLAVDHRREARIRDAGNGDAAGPRKVAQRLAHLDRAGGAVEADDVDLHRIEHGDLHALNATCWRSHLGAHETVQLCTPADWSGSGDVTAKLAISSRFAPLRPDSTPAPASEVFYTGEASVTELSEPFAMSMPAVSKHLKVLERAGLIARGREAPVDEDG